MFVLQIPNGLGPTPRRPPLSPTDGLVLDRRDDLDGDKYRPPLAEDAPHVVLELLEHVEAIGGGIARLFRHPGVVDVLRVRHGLPAFAPTSQVWTGCYVSSLRVADIG
jgi:hypothetical protein